MRGAVYRPDTHFAPRIAHTRCPGASRPVGPRWLSRIDPRRLGTALSKGERERSGAARARRVERERLCRAPFQDFQGTAGMQPLVDDLSRIEIAFAPDGSTESAKRSTCPGGLAHRRSK